MNQIDFNDFQIESNQCYQDGQVDHASSNLPDSNQSDFNDLTIEFGQYIQEDHDMELSSTLQELKQIDLKDLTTFINHDSQSDQWSQGNQVEQTIPTKPDLNQTDFGLDQCCQVSQM